MSNLSKEEIEYHYSRGWRGRKTRLEPAFYNVNTGEGMPVLASGFNPEMWRGLKSIEISRTWKERHAKGTPVKMDRAEFSECSDTGYIYPIVRDFNNGNPIARVEFPGIDKTVATFCNFRYRQSWLEKKGGSDGR